MLVRRSEAEKGELTTLVEGFTDAQLKAVDCQLRCRDLCRKLTDMLFMTEELQSGTATDARTPGISLLHSNKLYAIRGRLQMYGIMHVYVIISNHV